MDLSNAFNDMSVLQHELQLALNAILISKTQIHFIVGNDFVRYLLLPWNEKVATKDELLAYFEYYFEVAFSENAGQWSVQIGSAKYGQPCLATAIPIYLLEALNEINQPLGKVRSVTPAIMNTLQNTDDLPTQYWLVEEGLQKIHVGLMKSKNFQSFKSHMREFSTAFQEALCVYRETILMGDLALLNIPILLNKGHSNDGLRYFASYDAFHEYLIITNRYS